ncbi:MAG TPA: hypothetical protein VFN28_09870, partial [Amaricoccus sp.]|nr:hypothetical protein [Amaricoccus sp.]
MLRTTLVSALILTALPAWATVPVATRVVERGDGERVKLAPGAAAATGTTVEIVFGMGRAASAGFVAAAGRRDGASRVTVSRGPGPAGLCPAPRVR